MYGCEFVPSPKGDVLGASSRLQATLEGVPAHKQEAFIQQIWLTVELMR